MSSIESVSHETRVFQPHADVVKNAAIPSMDAYNALCDEAEKDYEGYWAKLARELLAMVQGPPKSPQSQQIAKSDPFSEPRRVYDPTSNDSAKYPRDPVESPQISENPSPAPEPVDKTLLPGEWSASREDGSKFRLVLTDEGTFIWKFSAPNHKSEELRGNYSVDGPVLILERKEGGALAGTAKFTGDTQMNFKLVGAPPEDHGLDFAKS